MADTIKKDAKRSFSNTVSAGLKSLGGGGKTFYVLEFKNNSQMHKAKTTKEIIIDYIELGRSPKCQIRFGEDCRTVSGVHCAIMREGDHYFVKHLSKSNPTLINGKPVADKYYINSGDELTLSYGGPIIGFIVPQNNLTSSIPLTRRLSLFREQAMRPYKRAIALLSIIMLLTIAGSSYFLINQSKVVKEQGIRLSENEKQRKIDSTEIEILKEKGLLSDEQYKKLTNDLRKRPIGGGGPGPDPSLAIKSLYKSIYYISVDKITVDVNGETKTVDYSWSGTGFLLNDGRFVTARHVIEGWYYSYDDLPFMLNEAVTNGNKVIAYFSAWSSTGDQIKFSSDQFTFDKSADIKENYHDSATNKDHLFTIIRPIDDWAFGRYSKTGILKIDSKLSTNLPVSTQLFTLGFPLGIGAEDRKEIEPIYSPFVVSSSGMSNGSISISSKSFDHGNSGGPVFTFVNNEYRVIGIVSRGRGTSQGFIIPISKIN